MKKILCLLFAILLPYSLYAAKENIVAEVNGAKITKEVFDASFKQNLMFVTDKKVTKEKVLDDLIHRELGIQKAKKNKLDQDPVVRNKMLDIMYHAQVSKDLEDKLKDIKVEDDEVKAYYKNYPEIRAAHILFRVQVEPEKKESEAAMTQALKVYESLKKKPGLFSEMANKYSQSSNAPAGGDLGFQPAIMMAPEFFQNIKGKEVGFISPPVRTQFGYHIIKVLAIKEFKDINLPRYKKIVFDQKRDKLLESYFEGLKKGAKISINKELLK